MKRLRFGCMIDKINGTVCEESFNNEIGLYTHMLFEHGFLMPVCSTGIELKIFHDNMNLIKQFRSNRHELSEARNLLKQRLLKSMYGKKINMKDPIQSQYFISSLYNHDNNVHSRIAFINHKKYDHHRDLNIQLEKKLKMKGIVNR